jgi:hypothetical protein
LRYGGYPLTEDGVEVRRVFHNLRSLNGECGIDLRVDLAPFAKVI